MTTTRAPADRQRVARGRSVAVLALSLVAVAVLVARAIRTATEDGPLAGSEVVAILLALAAAALAIAGAVMVPRIGRWAAFPIGVALIVELVLLNGLAPPRLIAAVPLFFALSVLVVPARPQRAADQGDAHIAPSAPGAVVVAALGLMVPVGVVYLATGIVAPTPDLFGAYVLFGLLLTATVWLAVRRSWWAIAMPLVSAGCWVLMLWLGEQFLDWTA